MRWSLAVLLVVLGAGRPARAATDAADAVKAIDARRLHALIINGGGNPQQNYQSHHLHVTSVVDLLRASGVSPRQISVFASDGQSAAPDMAVRASQPEELEKSFWQLRGTRLERLLAQPVVLQNATLPGQAMAPATREALGRWFEQARGRLRPGDTLFLYVTDHGTRGKDSTRDNEITLWGKDQSLTVSELAAMLTKLDPGVKVVSLMSQCFSGGFARLQEVARSAGRAPFCGYFSSTADRPAYGCYPENRDKDNVGHSFQFLSALQDGRSLATAHRDVLAGDDTPDVPLATSDVYLEELLTKAAAAGKRSLAELVDPLLKEAWRDGKRWEPEIRLLDRIGSSFGMWSPRSLAELERQAGSLPEFSKKVEAHRDAWVSALVDLNVGKLMRLEEKQPEWAQLLRDSQLQPLTPEERRALTTRLLSALDKLSPGKPVPAGTATSNGKGTDSNGAASSKQERVLAVRDRADQTAALAYRLEVRQGVVLRIRARLLNIAGRVYLAKHGTPAERKALADLQGCEALRLPPPGSPRAPLLSARSPFPPFNEDVALAGRVLPAWMGITFEGISPVAQKRYKLPAGAAFIRNVFPGSPAGTAGLTPGDILLGPRGQPFTEYNEVRVWTFLSKPGEPQTLEVLRAGQRTTVPFTPGTFPGELPDLPGPPKPGVKAPALSVAPYRGKVTPVLASAGPRLLFFWATYCGPCKASLPEVLAFGRERGVPVLAISDEPLDTLNEFFAAWKQPFPALVAHDELRQAAVAYGTSGVPTFVFIDDKGIIRSHVTGYHPAKGIGVPGWKLRGH